MVFATIRMHPEPAHRMETLEILRSIQGPVRACPGCVSCRICEEEDHDCAICYNETWDNDDCFGRHVRSDLFSRVLFALDLSKVPPEIRFFRVAATEGMELIWRLRGLEADPDRVIAFGKDAEG